MHEQDVATLRGDLHFPSARVQHSESRVPGVVRAVGLSARLPAGERQWKIPSGNVKLVLHFADNPKILGNGTPVWRAPADAIATVVGPISAVGYSDWSGFADFVQVQLTPLAARAVLGVPMSELANAVTDLRDITAERGRLLAERIADTPAPARLGALQAAIERSVVSGPPVERWVEWAWRRVQEGHGERVESLAAEIGVSRRHFTRKFQEQVGISPKKLVRMVRMQKALGLLRAGVPLADMAVACGFYDQSHLDNDFREFAGRPPSVVMASASAGPAKLDLR